MLWDGRGRLSHAAAHVWYDSAMEHPFLERLRAGPILADGAMGTMLYARGIDYRRCFEELNYTQPDLVQGIHRDYIAAGAELIETNTFGANRFRLAAHGLEERVRDCNYYGVKVAREAREVAGEPVFVAGSIGPTGLAMQPGRLVQPAEVLTAYREQVEGLLEGGADLLVFETFTDLAELRLAAVAAREACDLPLILQMTFTEDGTTLAGDTPEVIARALSDLGAAAMGVNCSMGPQGVFEALSFMRPLTGLALSALPNAGFPVRAGDRYFYLASPAYFAEYARRFVSELGIAIVGGCCGTTPEHTAAMAEALRTLRPATPLPAAPTVVVVRATEEELATPTASPEPTTLAQKLAAGKFVVSVELDPPKGSNPNKIIKGAAMLKEQGVDCINIGDSPMARVRMSALALAYLVKEQVGIETIIHFTTRDRNLMAIQADLLGAHAMGIRNIIALTGDPPRLGDYPNATGIWDVDSIGLVHILKQLNQGKDWAGNSIGRATRFFVAVAANPNALDVGKEKERFRRKLEAGGDVVMTQPLYDRASVEQFLEDFGPISVPVILGVLPVQSFRHAEFLHNEVPGIEIPAYLRERMRLAGENSLAEGIAQARDFLSDVRDLVQGIYLMPSFGRYEVVAEVAKGVVM